MKKTFLISALFSLMSAALYFGLHFAEKMKRSKENQQS
jgi:hypothetical protein